MNNRILFLFLSVISLLLIFTGIYFYKSKFASPVKVGVVLPLTGDFEIFGKRGLHGLQLAVHDINKAGGVLGGRPLELVIEDNKTDPGLARRLTKKLIQEDDVVAVVGPVSSSARNAMTEVAQEFRTPLLYGIDYEGGIYNRYLFCYSPIPDHYIKPLIPHLIQQQAKTFYIFGYDYIWPHNIAKAVESEVAALGGEVVGVEFTSFGKKDFTKPLDRIKKSGADALILILPGNDGFTFIRQFAASSLKEKVKLAAMASEESYLKVLKPEELEGVITALQFVSSLEKDEAKSFVRRQKEMFGEDSIVTYASESHYGLILLLKGAIEKAGSLDREQIVDAMVGLKIIVGNGQVRMREDHNMDLNMLIAQFNKGKLIVKKDIGLIVPADQRQKATSN